jgi:DmsE family decaheme c-type cytochrome
MSSGTLALLVLAGPAAAAQEPYSEDEYIGEETCVDCHDDLAPDYWETPHAKAFAEQNAFVSKWKRSCEACHGPGEEHEEWGGDELGKMVPFRSDRPEDVERQNAACMNCHEGGERLYWEGGSHDAADVGCTSCHSIHEKRSPRNLLTASTETGTCGGCHPVQRAQQFRNSHMPVREGKMSCSSCHNTHGTITRALIPDPTINDNCYRCHAEKRGPFLWEHAPANESCLDCHLAHGSTRDGMLRSSAPRLCQECHGRSHAPNPRSPNSHFVLGGSCLNCHPQIHGSNHPSGSGLSR